MAAGLRRRLETAGSGLSLLLARRPLRYPEEIISLRAQRLDEAAVGLREGLVGMVQTSLQRLDKAQARLEALSPLSVLKRGYAVVRKLPGEKIVRSVKEIANGDRTRLDFADGRALAEIHGVESGEKRGE